MNATQVRLLVLAALVGVTPALAQGAVDPNQPLPPGHPSTATDDAGGTTPPTPEDRISPAADLRAGTIQVYLRDPSEGPFANTLVHLTISKQDVAEGDSKSERTGTTNGDGVIEFDGLPTGTAYSFRVTVNRAAAAFNSESLRLTESGGQRVLLHVYPVTRDLREALVGMRGVVFVQPREDVFQVEANFQVLNIGKNAWVPDGVTLELPKGAKAFRAGDAATDIRAERTPSGSVAILGTFSPGQHEVGFQFQLDNPHNARANFHIGLPPHVAELRVVAEGSRTTVLTAEGFPDAQPMQGQDGSRLLVTGRRLARGEPVLDAVDVTLDNLPVPSLGRWYAVGFAVLLAAFGLSRMLGRGEKTGARGLPQDESKEAESLVLDELVELERLRRGDRIGPRTYEEARVALLDALARLEAQETASN
jgi:hypothetical protein